MEPSVQRIIEGVGTILLGKTKQVNLAVACLLAKGHLLIEDLPGMGKTTLAQSLAQVLGLKYERVQFTSDLLPADILGVSIFNKQDAEFLFHPGPIFTQILLADEINRATPKTQSALLEAMEEGQVSIEGKTRPLPNPFFVIATQNPLTQIGTYPLPESQLDRFLMRLSIGYPSPNTEKMLYLGENPRENLKKLKQVINLDELAVLQSHVNEIKVNDNLVDYLQRLVQFTRSDAKISMGLSPRGALSLLRAAKAWALIQNRNYVIPDDIQSVFPWVVEHRLKANASEIILPNNETQHRNVAVLSEYCLNNVSVLV